MGASPQVVDWDEDNDQDLLVGEYDGHVHFYENIGSASNPVLTDRGHLQAGGIDIDVTQLAVPVVHDWNEDGLKDLIIGNDMANIRIYLNVGSNENPVFNTYTYMATDPAISQIKNAPDLDDLNGDGLKDLAFGWWQGTVVYYPNSGTNANPVFSGAHNLSSLGTTIDPGGWTHLEVNDWNQDGDLDLIYGEWNGDIYYYENLSGNMISEPSPLGGPIVIPATGGSFDYHIFIGNNTTYNIPANVWTVLRLPDGREFTGMLNVYVTISAGAQVHRERTQNVAGSAPPGNYTYFLRWGQYPNEIWAEGSFPFTKSTTDMGDEWIDNWECNGEPLSTYETGDLPTGFALFDCYPNPFNPETTLRFALPQATNVTLKIYDAAGREVALLINGRRSAGVHEVTWSAATLPSGIYIYRLQAGDFSAAGKMVLAK